MENMFLLGLYIAVIYAVIKAVECRSKGEACNTKPIIRDSLIVYCAATGGIYIASNYGGIALSTASAKSKTAFTGLPDF